MLILGLNAYHADAAAVLLRDGELVAAVAEERLNRVKHYAGFPGEAIREVLRIGGATIDDVAHVAIARDGKANLASKLAFSLKNLTRISRLAKQRLQNRAKIASVADSIDTLFDRPAGSLSAEVHNVEHHLAHLASAFLVSPFDDAALMSVDGFGDFVSTMVGSGRGRQIEVYDRTLFPHSLGILYSAVCQFIGFDRYGDEGKVMGLAPYGEDAYPELFEEMVELLPDGKFKLALDYFIHHSEGVDYHADEDGKPVAGRLYSDRLITELGPPRERGAPITDRERNLARSLQAGLERAYFHILNALHARSGNDRLCLAGGVALNSVANGKILDQTPFRHIYCQPAATDDGTAIGAAYWVHNVTLDRPRTFVMHHAYTGATFDDAECAAALGDAGLAYETLDEETMVGRVASALAEGQIVGWFQGAAEWGPRALGHRSILANPATLQMKDQLNARIKHREPFRPFAPSVLEERVGDLFETDHPAPFMTMVYKVKAEWRDRLAAINHVDDTGRLQTVSAAHSPLYHRLISAFGELTGLPVVLNTSFNENEPIVYGPAEAVACFTRTKMDLLVLGPHLCVQPPG